MKRNRTPIDVVNCKVSIICTHEERKIGYCNLTQRLACVASVSVRFRSKERPRNGIFGIGHSRNGKRAKKLKEGGGGKEG